MSPQASSERATFIELLNLAEHFLTCPQPEDEVTALRARIVEALTQAPASPADPPLEALRALFAVPHINLGDLVYKVRESEGLGWDGPAASAWGKAVQKAEALLASTPKVAP